ncbi:MAG TPA: sigma factor-like helix-turn-helix DNA-binding protein [Acidimicrobiales bacterium]
MREHSIDPDVLDVLDFHQDGFDPEADLARRERLYAAIDELPPELRDVINGLYWEQPAGGKQELARRLGVSRMTVAYREKRALARLAEVMADAAD